MAPTGNQMVQMDRLLTGYTMELCMIHILISNIQLGAYRKLLVDFLVSLSQNRFYTGVLANSDDFFGKSFRGHGWANSDDF